MIDVELELMNQNEDWRLVLEAYRNAEIEHCESDSESDRWLARLSHVDQVAPDKLPTVHGKLIALELLKFQLANRTDGVRYRITSYGQKMLDQLSQVPDELSSDQDDGELAQSA